MSNLKPVRLSTGTLHILCAFGLAALMTGCTAIDNALQGDRVDYKSAKQAPSIEVPPDLSQLARDNRFAIPGQSSVSASALQGGARITPAGSAIVINPEGIKLERNAAGQRYLTVNRKAEEIWPMVREFWQSSGFGLVVEQADAGIIETEWAENRAKLPQDLIRATLGRVVDNFYSTGERDKFRTRLERTAAGTEIYLTHRGMQEVIQGALKDSTVWTQRPADPELEAVFLQRLMVRLGQTAEVAKAQVTAVAGAAPAPAAPAGKLTTVGGAQVLEVAESFDRAWRRVGVALDRSGFTVEDRDRSKGVYFVRYVDPAAQRADERGFLAKLFGGDQKLDPTRYEVFVKAVGAATQVSVGANAQGKPDVPGKILVLLADSMK